MVVVGTHARIPGKLIVALGWGSRQFLVVVMSIDTVSPETIESARKTGARIRADIGSRLAEVTQARAADCMGVSASTVSRAVADLDHVCHLLAALGLQVAPLDAVVATQADVQALERMAYRYLQSRLQASKVGI